ncbi:MAG: hypothetical protein R6V58_03520 [Planctomycetota bacterium]
MTDRQLSTGRAVRLWGLVLAAGGVLAAGCAGGPSPLLMGTGRAAVPTYRERGMSEANARKVARLEAVLAAQRDLVERYAGVVLPADQVDPFVEKAGELLGGTPGLIRGVEIERARIERGGQVYEVVVTSTLDELRAALGEGPDPRDPLTQAIRWPGASGGLPDE